MLKINIIVACDLNSLIGVNGNIPWHIPDDLKRFRRLTVGNSIICGRKTWESLPKKPLPGRDNIVISRTLRKIDAEAAYLCSSLDTAISTARVKSSGETFIIGGARLYEEALPIADRVYMTRIDTAISIDQNAGDEAVYFPKQAFKVEDWELMSWERSDKYPRVTFQIYDRRRG